MDVEEKRTVSWGAVIGGLVIAWGTGIFVSLGATAGSLLVVPEQDALGIILAVLVVMLFYAAIYWFTRRRVRDLALGILIGGFMVAISTGACGALLSKMT